MDIKNQKIPFLLSLFLSLIFLFPSLVKLEHFFEAHEHKLCSDTKIHIHEKDIDCSIDLFGFSYFQLDNENTEGLVVVIPSEEIFEAYTESPFICNKRFKSPRAPPL